MVKHITIILIAVVASLFVSTFTEKPSEQVIRKAAAILSKWQLLNPIEQIYFDFLGIQMDDYGEIDNVYIGRQYNPLTVAQYALEQYDRYLQGDSLAFASFLTCAQWLQLHTTRYKKYDVLEYRFPWKRYSMIPPWRSAMAQAQAMQVYVRAYRVTQDSMFLRNAERLQAAFFVEVDSGGVTYKDDDRHWWYEEYADEGGKETRVLNGMLVTLLGLYEYYTITGDTVSLVLFQHGVADLRESLGQYEGDGTVYYSLNRETASQFYQQVHVDLLRELYNITKDSEFIEYANRWESFLKKPLIVRFWKHPDRLGVAILVLNIFVIWFCLLVAWFILKKRKKPRVFHR